MSRFAINLWFDSQAEEAADFYVSVFKDGKKARVMHYTEVGQEIHGQQPGSVMTVDFEMLGQQFVALNGGPAFTFNEAISLVVYCETQEEIDYYWGKLSAVPEAEQCGWLKDKYGVSWQIVPTVLNGLMESGGEEKYKRVFAAMMRMKKLDIEALKNA